MEFWMDFVSDANEVMRDSKDVLAKNANGRDIMRDLLFN